MKDSKNSLKTISSPTKKIKTALNIDSLPITAEEGMKKTIESFILDKK